MVEVVYFVAASVDGYIAGPTGDLDWLQPFQQGAEDYGYADFYASVDVRLEGSRTYEFELALPEWPAPDKPTIVFTQRDLRVAHDSVQLTREDVDTVMQRLEQQGMRRAWLVGGGELATAFRARGLITRYIISLVPVVLGAGIPLTAPLNRVDALHLTRSRTYPSGIVQLTYDLPTAP